MAQKKINSTPASSNLPPPKKNAADSSEDSEVDELEAPDSKPKSMEDLALPQKLIALVFENKNIKQSLYPPCGLNASTTNGGGKKKVDAQWQLCVLLLGDITKYKDAIAAIDAVNNSKGNLSWANKMKNRLRMMAKTTHDYDAKMGQTGAGIENAAQIDMSATNSFTTKWVEISASCPWFFDMRTLIAQRPNLVPTGLGHSSTGVVAGGGGGGGGGGGKGEDGISSIPISDWDETPRHIPEPDSRKRSFSELDEELAVGSGDNYIPSSPVPSETAVELIDETEPKEVRVKAKGKEMQRKNPEKPNTSTPAAPAPTVAPKASKKTKLAEFSEIAKKQGEDTPEGT
ncbi:hypothetical protein C8R44DRAFT_894942 [Mycena epipterygia]|nr:hypothetical protein C8R44DRAFT_894942 [Mycena epipterygia]